MLSAWPIEKAIDAVTYFEKDNYYTKDGGYEHSSWVGKGAEALGLRGEIKPDEFKRILEGKLPNGQEISTSSNKKDKDGKVLEHMPGTDFTFSAPKSVSIAALILGDNEIIEAHKHAVSVAMKFAEEHAAACYKKENKKQVTEKTGNLLVARFDHDTARETKDAPPDPHLHSHCIVMNATKRKDGKWVASPNMFLMKQRMLIGAIYRAQLAHDLQNMGYRVRRTHNDGLFELVGISREQIVGFSHRRTDVEKYMQERGLTSAAAAAMAAKNTRRKKKDIDRTGLKDYWHVQADALGIPNGIDAVKSAPRETREVFQNKTESEAGEEEARNAILHLSERQSVMNRYELLKIAMQRAVGQTTLPHIHAAFSKMASNKQLIKIDKEKFTTPKLLAFEEQNLSMIKNGLKSCNGLIGRETAAKAALEAGLNNGQSEAVALLSSTSRFVAVQGYAGTGKTSMLRVMHSIAKDRGMDVKGFAPTAAAAKQIENEAGIKSQTLESFLIRTEKQKGSSENKGHSQIWVVDEASMMSTQRAHRLFKLAQKENARVWLIGDKRQLGSIEAGGPFSLAVAQGMPYVEMKEILRQKDERLKSAVMLSIEDRLPESLSKIKDHVVEIRERDKCLDGVVAEYFKDKQGVQQDAIVITSTNEDRKEINRRIRSKLIDDGFLGKEAVQLPMLTKKHLTREETKRVWSYEKGDVVSFLKGYESLQIEKGDMFTVDMVDTKTGSLTLKHRHTQAVVEWMPRKASKAQVFKPLENTELRMNDTIRWTSNDKSFDVRNGELAIVKGFEKDGFVKIEKSDGKTLKVDLNTFPHWDHAYCSTVYSAQGKTCDRVIAHLDTTHKQLLGKEQFYVAISRARLQAKIFTNDLNALPKAIQPSRAQVNAVEVKGLPETKAIQSRGFER